MAKIDTVWVVRNPLPRNPDPTIQDVCFEVSVQGLVDYINGMPVGTWEAEQTSLHRGQVTAYPDAQARIAKARKAHKS